MNIPLKGISERGSRLMKSFLVHGFIKSKECSHTYNNSSMYFPVEVHYFPHFILLARSIVCKNIYI